MSVFNHHKGRSNQSSSSLAETGVSIHGIGMAAAAKCPVPNAIFFTSSQYFALAVSSWRNPKLSNPIQIHGDSCAGNRNSAMHDALKLWSQAACVIRSRNCKYFARDDETYATAAATALNGGKTLRGQGAAGLSWRGEDERAGSAVCVMELTVRDARRPEVCIISARAHAIMRLANYSVAGECVLQRLAWR